MGVRVNSTRDEPGGKSPLPASPHEMTTRRGGSTSTYSPRNDVPLTSTANVPPGSGCKSARSPIQATIRWGSTRWAKTISGDASMVISVWYSAMLGLLAGFRLGGLLQRGEMARPESIEEIFD